MIEPDMGVAFGRTCAHGVGEGRLQSSGICRDSASTGMIKRLLLPEVRDWPLIVQAKAGKPRTFRRHESLFVSNSIRLTAVNDSALDSITRLSA
jgi:hypothetical protein